MAGAVAVGVAAPCVAQFSFAPVINNELPTGHTPTAFVLRDLDGDGLLDAIVCGRNLTNETPRRTRISILRNVGGGAFVPWQELFASGGTGEALAVEDFDGDGRFDIAVSLNGPVIGLEVFLGTPNGFVPHATAILEREPRGMQPGDFDGDGDLDLAVANYSSSSITVLTNDGAGRFTPTRSIRVVPYSGGVPFPNQALVGDVNGDGHPDLVGITIGGARVSVALNRGDGTFLTPVDWRIPRIEAEQPAMTTARLADIDGDGDLDVVAASLLLSTQQRVYVFRNLGNGRFGPREFVASAPAGYAWSPAVGDLDGDGRPDLAVGTALAGFIALHRNETATPSAPLDLPLVPLFLFNATFNREMVMVDIDNDCDLDLVGIEIAISTLFVYRNETPQQDGCGGGGIAAVPDGGKPPAWPVGRVPLPADDAERAAYLLEAFAPGSAAARAAETAPRTGRKGGPR